MPETIERKYTCDSRNRCHCCGQSARRFTPLVWTNKGWTCASDDFCLRGTSGALIERRASVGEAR